MYAVTLTIDTLEGKDMKDAAILFLGAIMTADWSQGIMLEVSDGENVQMVRLDQADYLKALSPKNAR